MKGGTKERRAVAEEFLVDDKALGGLEGLTDIF